MARSMADTGYELQFAEYVTAYGSQLPRARRRRRRGRGQLDPHPAERGAAAQPRADGVPRVDGPGRARRRRRHLRRRLVGGGQGLRRRPRGAARADHPGGAPRPAAGDRRPTTPAASSGRSSSAPKLNNGCVIAMRRRGRRLAAAGAGRGLPVLTASPTATDGAAPAASRRSRCTTSAPATAASRCCTASTSPCRAGRASPRCSGPNGAGKTTTLGVMSGLLTPTSGCRHVQGRHVNGADADDLARIGICHIREGRSVFPNLSVADNLIVAASCGASLDRLAEVAFTLFPRLKERRKQLAGTLSGGEKQMLALARGLGTDPAVLLVDELSMGLAPLVVGELYEAVAEIAAHRRVGPRRRAVRHHRPPVRRPRLRDGPRRRHLRRPERRRRRTPSTPPTSGARGSDRAPPVHAVRADARLRLRHRRHGPRAHLHGHRRLQLRPRRRRHAGRRSATTSCGSTTACPTPLAVAVVVLVLAPARWASAPSGSCAGSRAPTTPRRSSSRSRSPSACSALAQQRLRPAARPATCRTCSATTASRSSTCRSPTTASSRSSSPLAVAFGLRFLLFGTPLGARMRAVVDDRELARLNGVRSVVVARFSWMIGFCSPRSAACSSPAGRTSTPSCSRCSCSTPTARRWSAGSRACR